MSLTKEKVKTKKINKESGITLTTLMITVTIILLLTAVTYRISYDDEGIISMTENQAEKANAIVEEGTKNLQNLEENLINVMEDK